MIDYCEKLAEIIKNNNIQSVSIVRMEVPCCGGLVEMVKKLFKIVENLFLGKSPLFSLL
jgi:hypothetical protein